MTIILTEAEAGELWNETIQNSQQILSREPIEMIYEMPPQLGRGYMRRIDIHPELLLTILDFDPHDEVQFKQPEWEHPVQFAVCLSGFIRDSPGHQWGGKHSLISGSGVQRQMTFQMPKSQRIVSVDIEMSPDMLRTLFPSEDGNLTSELSFLVKGNDWQTLIYPETNAAILGVAQQIVNCAMQGILKRIFLQGKIQELMALQLAPVLMERGTRKLPKLKASTIAQIHYARDILLSRIENPPSLWELAQQVGVSDRTLRRGFQELFGTTVIDFLTQKRMERAQQLLRSNYTSVSEVANRLGYTNMGHFASAFKRQFGIAPSECLLGKKKISSG
ncbi:AraC family transcriptional regulator [Microcoleus sp. F6_B4]